MPRAVSVLSESVKFAQTVRIGPHVIHSDEPSDVGGKDTGPDAQELLMASLGACANITAQMYAMRHGWPLEGVQAVLSYRRLLAVNSTAPHTKNGMVDQIKLEISFEGNLSEQQRQRLLDIAARCPVHRMLTRQVQTETTLLLPDPPAQT